MANTTYKSTVIASGRQKAIGAILSDKVTVDAALATTDKVRFGPFPPGIIPSFVKFVHGDLDTGTGALVAKVGYVHTDGTAGDDDLFGSGLATFAAVSGAGGSDLAASDRVEITKPFFIEIIPTTAANAMAAAKTVICTLFGELVGPK